MTSHTEISWTHLSRVGLGLPDGSPGGQRFSVASTTVLSRQSSAAPASGRLSSGTSGERYERETWWEGSFWEHRVAVSSQQSLGGLAKRRDHLRVRFPHLLQNPLGRRVESRPW